MEAVGGGREVSVGEGGVTEILLGMGGGAGGLTPLRCPDGKSETLL